MSVLTVLCVLLLFGPGFAHAWADARHRAISETVQSNLQPAAVKAIAKILGFHDDLPPDILAQLSLWPDQIRPLKKNPKAKLYGFTPDEQKEAENFFNDHPDNTDWHFADLPPGSPQYPDIDYPDPNNPVVAFVRSNDVVHMIQRCIEVLESESTLPGMTKLQALRWLIHLVEDLHQPLHIASGYYRTDKLALQKPEMIADPATVTRENAKNDRGGNVLVFLKNPQCPTKPTLENLHSVWDDCLLLIVTGARVCATSTTELDIAKLTTLLLSRMHAPETEGYHTRGDYHHWAEQWATDSIHVAKTRVFPSELADGCVIKDQEPPHKPIHVQSRISNLSKDEYLFSHKEDAAIQLTKAAVRLADLLNQIQWK